MNAIGFLINHDPHIPCSRDITSLFSSQEEQKELSGVVTYLNNGVPIIKFISSIYDESAELIGPNIIYTDGLWVWPGYFGFYLERYSQIVVPEAFLLRIESNRDRRIDLNEGEKMYVEYMIAKLLGIKSSTEVKPSSELEKLIEQRGDRIFCF